MPLLDLPPLLAATCLRILGMLDRSEGWQSKGLIEFETSLYKPPFRCCAINSLQQKQALGLK